MTSFIRLAAKVIVTCALLVAALLFVLVISDGPRRDLASPGETLVFHRTDLASTSAQLKTWTAPDGSVSSPSSMGHLSASFLALAGACLGSGGVL